MSKLHLLARDVVTDAKEAVRLRVLRVDTPHVWLFDMDAPLAWPFQTDLAPILQGLEDGQYKKVKASGGSAVTDAAREASYVKYRRLGSALKIDALITKAGRSGMLKSLVKEDKKLTRRTWHRAVRQFLRGGMVPTALAPRWDLSGQPPIDTEKIEEIPLQEVLARVREKALKLSLAGLEIPESLPRNTATGLLRKNLPPVMPTRYRVDRDTLRVFTHYYDRLQANGKNLPGVHKEMLSEVFIITDATGASVPMEATRIPSLPQFRHWYRELRTPRQRTVGRVGQHTFDLTLRPLVGNERSDRQKAGLECSGDATIWNVSVVSRCAGRRVIGCPVVFRIRCKRTGMLLGLSVSLAAASWTGMAAAIANCVEEKVEFCAKYGITITADEWPVLGLMPYLEVDRGSETHNHHPEPFIEATGADVISLKGQRPDLKPGVESDWRTLQVSLNGLVPGVLIETWQNTQNDKWKLNGEYDIDQFTKVLIQYELARMKKPREGVQLDDKMIAWGATPSPLSMWQYSDAEEGLGLLSFTLDEIQLSLMRREQASISPQGLLFKQMLYRSDELDAAEYSTRSRAGKFIPVTVAYDERLVDHVYITQINGEEVEPVIVCDLNLKHEHQRSYAGRCLEEVIELQGKAKINEAENRPILKQANEAAHKTSRITTADARDASNAAPPNPDSKTQQMKDIPANRRNERYAHGPENAFRPTVAGKAGPSGETPHDATNHPAKAAAAAPAPREPTKVVAEPPPAAIAGQHEAEAAAARKALIDRLRAAQRA